MKRNIGCEQKRSTSKSARPNLLRTPATFVYASALFAVWIWQKTLTGDERSRVVSETSTNIGNLQKGKFHTLWESLFITQEESVQAALVLAGLVCVCILGELWWGSIRLVGLLVIGHIGSTLLVAVGLVAAIRHGWVDASVAGDDDVGVSYAALCVLGALTHVMPGKFSLLWGVVWIMLALHSLWVQKDFTSMGHVIAVVLGVITATMFRAKNHCYWTRLRMFLLGGGALWGAGMFMG